MSVLGFLSGVWRGAKFLAHAGERGVDINDPNLWRAISLGFPYGMSGAGVNVTPDKSLSVAAYYACIYAIASDLASLPLHVFRDVSEDVKERVKGHRLEYVFNVQPNPEMTALAFRETIVSQMIGWGNAYAEIVFDSRGEVESLWPIHCSRVRVTRAGKTFGTDDPVTPVRQRGALCYEVLQENGQTVSYDPGRILHFHGLGYDGVSGYSVLKFMSESIGGSLATQTYVNAFFKNGAHAGGAVEHPKRLKPEAFKHLKQSIDEKNSGAKNAFGTIILEEGAKFTKLSIPPEEAQLLEVRQFQVEEICRWFRMPPHKVQHLLRSTFNNVEELNRNYSNDTLSPWGKRFEQEIKSKLMDPADDLFVQHNHRGLLQGDSKSRAEYIGKMVANAIMTPNEGRAIEGLNPSKEAGADLLYMQGAMKSLERISNPPDPPDFSKVGGFNPQNEDQVRETEAWLRPFLQAAVTRVLHKNKKAVDKALSRYKDRNAFLAWSDKFYGQLRRDLMMNCSPALNGLQRVGVPVEHVTFDDSVSSQFVEKLQAVTKNTYDGTIDPFSETYYIDYFADAATEHLIGGSNGA